MQLSTLIRASSVAPWVPAMKKEKWVKDFVQYSCLNEDQHLVNAERCTWQHFADMYMTVVGYLWRLF